MLNNIQDLEQDLKAPIVHLLKTGEYTPVIREGDAPVPARTSRAWVLMIAEQNMPKFAKCSTVGRIKVPPLRVRKADMESIVNYNSRHI